MFSFRKKQKENDDSGLTATKVEHDTIDSQESEGRKSFFTTLKGTGQTLAGGVKQLASESGKKAGNYFASASEKASEFDFANLKDADFYKTNASILYAKSADTVTGYFNRTFEIDKDTSQMLEDIKTKLPERASDMSDIFEQCKKEALQRAISAFCLGPIMHGLDSKLEARYDNLSDSYKDFDSMHGVRRHDNYKKMGEARQDARETMMYLEDGYNTSNLLDPFSSDIEHVISAKEQYSNTVLRAATTNDELKDKINREENLVFADSSLNRAKGSKDLMQFIDERGVVDELDPDIIHIEVNGQFRTVNKKDVKKAYSDAKKATRSDTVKAIATIGATAVESGAKLAIQQVVGLIIYETVDIIVDELKDIAQSGNVFNKEFKLNLERRSTAIQEKLKQRFEERDIVNRAKSLGVESAVAGALSIIPQILLALLLKTPAFIIALIRESTLSMVRCVRVLMDKNVDRYQGIQVVLAGTATAVLGVYINRVISAAIAGVPILNKFNRSTTDVLTGVFVTAIPLVAVYTFDTHKKKFSFALQK